MFETEYASERQLISWVLSWRDNARLIAPPELAAEAEQRLALLRDRHGKRFEVAETVRRPLAQGNGARPRSSNGRSESVIRPERFARLVTLAGLLIGAARDEGSLPTQRVLDELNISLDELREDLDVLNVVNFGGGTYVLYAEIVGDRIEVDPDTYGDNFARPARLLPLEAKALVAAIDLFGDHLPQSGLQSAREKIIAALGHDPSEEGLEIAPGRDDSSVVRTVNEAIGRHRMLELHYYKENEDEFTKRVVEPYQLVNGPEGWYLGCFDLDRSDIRHFRLDRMKEAVITEREFEPREGVPERLAEQEWLVRGEVSRRRGGAGLGLARARPLAAGGAHRGRGARRRRRGRRASLRLRRLARPRGAQGRRRPGRPRARRRARGGPQGRRGRLIEAPMHAGAPVDAAPGHPRIERIVAPNPGPMTLEGTNTYVVGTPDGAYVIDPGPADPGHVDEIRARAAAGGGIAGVLVTHGHPDHDEAAPALGAEVLWPPGGPPGAVAAGPFRALRTPGHSADHVCFLLEDVCFCGDLILGHGSAIVPPRSHGGSLADYLSSLEAVRDAAPALLAPGHGPWIENPGAKVDEYLAHRRERERLLVAALASGERSREALLDAAWGDVPAKLRPAAALAMQAHLEKLDADGALDGIELSGPVSRADGPLARP